MESTTFLSCKKCTTPVQLCCSPAASGMISAAHLGEEMRHPLCQAQLSPHAGNWSIRCRCYQGPCEAKPAAGILSRTSPAHTQDLPALAPTSSPGQPHTAASRGGQAVCAHTAQTSQGWHCLKNIYKPWEKGRGKSREVHPDSGCSISRSSRAVQVPVTPFPCPSNPAGSLSMCFQRL